jgi:CRISPR/Cas system CMR subunit Cmr4 (Cas7 group RAMP superfamily)
MDSKSRQKELLSLDMNEECLERGGNSTVHRGVFTEYLGTNHTRKN